MVSFLDVADKVEKKEEAKTESKLEKQEKQKFMFNIADGGK